MKLISKTKIHGTITTETGLHIGGSKSTLDIGGIDSPVIKTALGVPYIPGSSLKGKLRSLLAAAGNGASIESEDLPIIKQLFGYAGDKKNDGVAPRIIVRDAPMDTVKFKETFLEDVAILETEYTQEKMENRIDRVGGKAANGGIRSIERVPSGAIFNFEIILNLFEGDDNDAFLREIKKGIKLLESDYLGGSGTRGYGKVSFDYSIDQPTTY